MRDKDESHVRAEHVEWVIPSSRTRQEIVHLHNMKKQCHSRTRPRLTLKPLSHTLTTQLWRQQPTLHQSLMCHSLKTWMFWPNTFSGYESSAKCSVPCFSSTQSWIVSVPQEGGDENSCLKISGYFLERCHCRHNSFLIVQFIIWTNCKQTAKKTQ